MGKATHSGLDVTSHLEWFKKTFKDLCTVVDDMDQKVNALKVPTYTHICHIYRSKWDNVLSRDEDNLS